MRNIYKYFRSFAQDIKGTVSVEFVMIAPLVAAWVLISYSFFDGFKTYMRANKATYTAVDLVSRQDVVDDAFIQNVGSIFSSIVDSDGTEPTLVVTSVTQLEDVKRIQWSTAVNGGQTIDRVDDLPLEALPNMVSGESLILIQTGVPFEPRVAIQQLQATVFRNTVAVTPRFHTDIRNTDQPFDPNRAVNSELDNVDSIDDNVDVEPS